MPEKTCVIVGASHAGVQLALSLRQGGWTGRILLVGDESSLPYQRPPLSKGVLDGSKTAESIGLRPSVLYEKSSLEFLPGKRVTHIDRNIKAVSLDDGESISYDKLALTPGARPRIIPFPGIDLEGIFYLRSLADAERIRPCVEKGRHAVIIGGGYIGLEAAAVLSKCGMEVTVIEAMPRVLQRVTAPEVSAFFERIHREEGVQIKTGVQVASFTGNGHVERVVCANGDEYQADLVLIAVGVVPNMELAIDAGLEVNNGIVVNEFAQCSDKNIVAAGDCTAFNSTLYKRMIRLESVQNAMDQAKAAAASLNKEPQPYDALPWFWSEQFDVKLQIAGLSQDNDSTIIRGNPEVGRSFAVFYFSGKTLLSVDAINRPAEFMAGKRLCGKVLPFDRNLLSDEGTSIKDLLKL